MENYGNRRGNIRGRQNRNEEDTSYGNRESSHQYGVDFGEQSRPYGEDYGEDYGEEGYYGGGYDRRSDRTRNDWQSERFGSEGYRSQGYGGSSPSSDYRNRQQGGYGNTDYRSGIGGYSRPSGRSMRPDQYPSTYRSRESGYMSEDDYDRGSPFSRDNRGESFGRRQGRQDYGMHRNRGEERGYWDKTKDEISSWFGDDEAARRREQDKHRGKGPKNYKRSDERIQEEINDMLTDDPYLDASEIEVTVKNGEVTLTGTVDDRTTKRRAEDIAEQVSGVSHVENRIRATSNASRQSTVW